MEAKRSDCGPQYVGGNGGVRPQRHVQPQGEAWRTDHRPRAPNAWQNRMNSPSHSTQPRLSGSNVVTNTAVSQRPEMAIQLQNSVRPAAPASHAATPYVSGENGNGKFFDRLVQQKLGV